MHKVYIFKSKDHYDIERQIENLLNTFELEVVDVQYHHTAICVGKIIENIFSALIIVRDLEKKSGNTSKN